MDVFDAIACFGLLPSALLTGLLMGASFDAECAARALFPRLRVLGFIAEVIIMLLLGLTAFTFTLGTTVLPRYHTLFFMAAGFAAERAVLGRYAVRAAGRASAVISKLLRRVVKSSRASQDSNMTE